MSKGQQKVDVETGQCSDVCKPGQNLKTAKHEYACATTNFLNSTEHRQTWCF